MWSPRIRDYTDYPLSMGYIYLGDKLTRNKSTLVEIEGLWFF